MKNRFGKPETEQQKRKTGNGKPVMKIATKTLKPKIGHREPAENRKRRPETENRIRKPGNGKPETKTRKRKTGNEKPETKTQKWKTGNEKPDTWNRVTEAKTGNSGIQRLPQANPWLYQDAQNMKSKSRIQNPVTKHC